MVAAGSVKLKPYPFHDGQTNENAAIRVIRLVVPTCPADPNPEIIRKDGTTVPNPRYTGDPNCQMVYRKNNSGVWDVEKCEALGHDPWHTTFRKSIVEDVVGDDGYVTNTRTRIKTETRLNVIAVSHNPRHTTATEVALAMARGCRRLSDFGYADPCEFRSCSQPQRVTTRYGNYCSERHARLVAADWLEVALPIGGDPVSEDKAMRQRDELLDNLPIQARELAEAKFSDGPPAKVKKARAKVADPEPEPVEEGLD